MLARVVFRRMGALAALLSCLAAGGAARAAVFVVNTTSDGLTPGGCPPLVRAATGDLPTGACSLRTAILQANALAGADEIVINLSGVQTITLATSIEVTQDVQINAPALTGWNGTVLLGGLTIAGPGGVDLFKITGGDTELQNLALVGGNVLVDASSASVVFTQSTGTVTYSKNVGGDGALQKQGGGILVLTGTNTYAGGTEIGGGTLQGNTQSIPGGTLATPQSVVDDAHLVFDQATDDAFFGAISGTGSLEKIGAGTLTLGTPNTYSGGTTITAGKLVGFVSNSGSSLQGDIVDNAKLVFDQTDPADGVSALDGTFADNISGSGSVEKTGPGMLTLTGSNSFQGGLTISEGILVGDTDSIPGKVSIAADAELMFDQAADGTHSGNITGGGGSPPDGATLIKLGAGTLTLTGTNSYDGGTDVKEGTLQGTTRSLQQQINLRASTALVFAQDFDGTFVGDILGAGALSKTGSGALTLATTLTFTPSAATTIQGGRLVIGVAGSGDQTATTLPGDAVVGSSATLAGIGHVGGDVTVQGGGTIAPGGAPGSTLSVGSVSFEPGSVFEVHADDSGTDLLDVTGAATLTSAATLHVLLGSLDRTAPFDEVILQAGSLPNGSDVFGLNQTFAFFDASLTSSANDISLVLTPNGKQLQDFAQTRNEQEVGTALEDALAASTPPTDLDTVFGVLGGLSTSQIDEALNEMAGEQLTEFATTRLALADRFQTSLQQRIRGVAWNDGEALLAKEMRGPDGPVFAADPVLSRSLPGLAQSGAWPTLLGAQSMSSVLDSATSFQPEQGELGLGGWLDGYGLFGSLSGDSDTADLDYTIGGVSLGLDCLVAKNWLVGVAGGYAYSNLDFNGLSGNDTANTGQGGLYAGYVLPWLQLGASGRFGYSAMKTRRDIDFMGRNADGDFSGWDAGGRAEAALDLAKLGFVEIQPLASFSYTHVEQDSFDESGAGSLSLDVKQQTVDSLVSGVGARLHGLLELDKEIWFHPELRATWLHEFGDRERELDARIGGTPGAIYTVRGAKPAADAGVFGMRWTVIASKRLHAFADYDVTVSDNLLQQGVSAGFKFVW